MRSIRLRLGNLDRGITELLPNIGRGLFVFIFEILRKKARIKSGHPSNFGFESALPQRADIARRSMFN
jgi:hypothetical protein